jgi:glycerol-3-phosphate dehydrogenase (NAD(P)+)
VFSNPLCLFLAQLFFTSPSCSLMKIAVFGAGAWGTALAQNAAHHLPHSVTLWARDTQLIQTLQAQLCNSRYLPGINLSAQLHFSSENPQHLASQSDLIILATPMAALRSMLEVLGPQKAPIVWLCKGFENRSTASSPAPNNMTSQGLLGHEVFEQVHQANSNHHHLYGVLSGPSFAKEVALSQPTALVAASPFKAVNDLLVQAFHNPSLRIYANPDVIGVEVGGAVKNVLAIATGLCDGLDLGLNARAALITRGLAEMTRLGEALGADRDTFMGLSGLGDLVLTATGSLSRNRQVGLLLAQGQSLEQAVNSLGHVAEGVACAHQVLQRSQNMGIEMPITKAVVAVLQGQLNAAQAVLW